MYDPLNKPFIQQGWQCPVCGKVYAPSTPMCWSCPAKADQTWINGTGQAPDKPNVKTTSGNQEPDMHELMEGGGP
jgi:hypothetical protein